MAKAKTKKTTMDIKPISAIARRHTRRSYQVGHFASSEGYEIVRTCHDDMVVVRYHPATQGSAFGAPAVPASLVNGRYVIGTIAHELRALGYDITVMVNQLEMQVRQVKA